MRSLSFMQRHWLKWLFSLLLKKPMYLSNQQLLKWREREREVLGFEICVVFSKMDQSPPHEQQQLLQMQSPASKADMIDCVIALERALLPCLPARELQATLILLIKAYTNELELEVASLMKENSKLKKQQEQLCAANGLIMIAFGLISEGQKIEDTRC